MISNDRRSCESCGAKRGVFWLHYPPIEKEGGCKKVWLLRNATSFHPEMKIQGKKMRQHCCSLSLKKGSVYICQWDKRYCEALLRYTWHGPERQVGYWTSEFWSNFFACFLARKNIKECLCRCRHCNALVQKALPIPLAERFVAGCIGAVLTSLYFQSRGDHFKPKP